MQGSELDALRGAPETMKRTTFITTEVSVVDYNEGGVCYDDVNTIIRNYGFALHDIIEFHSFLPQVRAQVSSACKCSRLSHFVLIPFLESIWPGPV